MMQSIHCPCNDAPQEDSDDEKDETPHAKLIKTTNKFLVIIDQQKALIRRNKVPVELVEQLETLIVGNQISLCSKEKEVTDYFKSFSQSPNPKNVYKTVVDVLSRYYYCRFLNRQYIGDEFN